MEGCFTFQWGGCFSDGGGFYSWGFIFKWEEGCPMGGGISFDGEGFSKKILGWEGHPPHASPPPTMGNPEAWVQIMT